MRIRRNATSMRPATAEQQQPPDDRVSRGAGVQRWRIGKQRHKPVAASSRTRPRGSEAATISPGATPRNSSLPHAHQYFAAFQAQAIPTIQHNQPYDKRGKIKKYTVGCRSKEVYGRLICHSRPAQGRLCCPINTVTGLQRRPCSLAHVTSRAGD